MKWFLSALLLLWSYFLSASPAFAIVDPLSVSNNKFGIHIISASLDEILPAAELVNSSGGDWGYITVLIESKDRDHDKWQKVFDLFRQRHLIPLVRIATQPSGGNWKRPYEGEEIAWADFFDNLVWPTKNRYIIVYNEPNHSAEWQGSVDAADYAKTLEKTIDVLKKHSEDYFILNAGFDASAPDKRPQFADEKNFLQEMNQAVPGIFEKLDGWASHSYPNPEFSGSPDNSGKGSIRTWQWELELLKSLGVKKSLSVFITETGWKHAEGQTYNRYLLDKETVAEYYEKAFKEAWSSNQIVVVTPFLLNYQESPFDHFSFKKYKEDDYYPQFFKVKDLPKKSGLPAQIVNGKLTKGWVYPSIVAGESYILTLTFKNTGQSIWNERSKVKLVPSKGKKELNIDTITIPDDTKILPGQDYTFNFKIKAPKGGKYLVRLNLFDGAKQFDILPVEFTTEVKLPVLLKIKAALRWKKDYAGNYLLTIVSATGQKISELVLGSDGFSSEIEARYLPPDLSYNFTLEKPFYEPKTITQRLTSGENIIDFGELQPDIPSAILHPKELWKLLPWSSK